MVDQLRLQEAAKGCQSAHRHELATAVCQHALWLAVPCDRGLQR